MPSVFVLKMDCPVFQEHLKVRVFVTEEAAHKAAGKFFRDNLGDDVKHLPPDALAALQALESGNVNFQWQHEGVKAVEESAYWNLSVSTEMFLSVEKHEIEG